MCDFVEARQSDLDAWRYKRRRDLALEQSRQTSYLFNGTSAPAMETDDAASKLLFRRELERLQLADYPPTTTSELESLQSIHASMLTELDEIFASSDSMDALTTPPHESSKKQPMTTFGSSTAPAASSSSMEIEELEMKLKEYAIDRTSNSVGHAIEARLIQRMMSNWTEELTQELAAEMVNEAKAVPKSIDYSDFDPAVVKKAKYDGPGQQILIHKFNVDLTRRHILCLEPRTWLNDEVINFWFQMLNQRDEERVESGSYPVRSHFFSTFFLTKLLERGKYTYANVRRWTRKFDLFARDRVFVPVNINNVSEASYE